MPIGFVFFVTLWFICRAKGQGLILVVGSTGVLGRTVIRQLLMTGHSVRAVTRFPEKANELQAQGAEVVSGDLIDPSSLAGACRGVEKVLSAAHSLMGTGKYRSEAVDDLGQRSLIDAAKASGVQHFVFVSARGVSLDHPVDFFRTKRKVEEHLKASGLSHTILRPSAFMEWHVHFLLGKSALESGKVTIFGKGDNLCNFIAAEDVARFAVIALSDPNAKGKIIEIGGIDNISRNKIAEIYSHLSGRSVKVKHVPASFMRVMSPILRPIRPVLSRLMALSAWTDTTDQTFDPTTILKEYPMSLTRVEDFVRERVAETTP